MALARWQQTIVDTAGNVLSGAEVTVRRETAGAPLAILYSDRAGTTAMGNPLTTGPDGLAAFYAAGGAYRIDAVYGSYTQTWRYVGVGLAAESDGALVGSTWIFDNGTADSDPGAGALRFNNATPASATAVYVDDLDTAGADMSSWLERIDDYGDATDRGVLTIRSSAGDAELVARVTGSVADGTGYHKLSVTVLATTAAPASGAVLSVDFTPRGIDGADGEVAGPGFSVDGQIVAFNGTTGNAIEGAVVSEGSPTDPLISGTTAGVRAGTPGHVIEAGHLRSASALVTLGDAATITPNWEAAINFTLTVAGNRQLNTPSNGIPGTWRTIYVAGNDGTARTLTFPAAWAGVPPTLTDITSTKTYLLTIYCRTASSFIVTSTDASP